MVALLDLFLAYADALIGFALPRMPSDVAKMCVAHLLPVWIALRPAGGQPTRVGYRGWTEDDGFEQRDATLLLA
jgi:hypothetical protein